MAILTANGVAVAEGTLNVPRTGRPAALLSLATALPPAEVGGAVTLRFETGQEFAMTCTRTGPEKGGQQVRVVGGRGKLETVLGPRFYQGIPAQLAILDILNEAGETPGAVDAPELFTAYVRQAKPAWVELHRALDLLPGRVWRVRPDGAVFVGRETDATHPETPEVWEAGFGLGRYILPLSPALRVGERLRARYLGQVRDLGRLERVIHRIGPRSQTEVLCV
ncbi:MAG: hypothetical protein SF070_18135 [Gemmatimonadota bacterium]|nr:hypothetical protein [Gemmatimonadota bacterium]